MGAHMPPRFEQRADASARYVGSTSQPAKDYFED
jgi:hypothetical protein